MRADQRAITQASRQSWREPACRASAARCVIKLTNKSKSARPKTIRNHTQLIIREGFTFIYFQSLYDTRHFFLSVLSPPYIFVRCNHAAFGLFPWSMELLALQVTIKTPWHLQVLFAPKMLDHLLSLSFQSIILCERA